MENKKQHTHSWIQNDFNYVEIIQSKSKSKAKLKKRTQTLKNDAKLKIVF